MALPAPVLEQLELTLTGFPAAGAEGSYLCHVGWLSPGTLLVVLPATVLAAVTANSPVWEWVTLPLKYRPHLPIVSSVAGWCRIIHPPVAATHYEWNFPLVLGTNGKIYGINTGVAPNLGSDFFIPKPNNLDSIMALFHFPHHFPNTSTCNVTTDLGPNGTVALHWRAGEDGEAQFLIPNISMGGVQAAGSWAGITLPLGAGLPSVHTNAITPLSAHSDVQWDHTTGMLTFWHRHASAVSTTLFPALEQLEGHDPTQTGGLVAVRVPMTTPTLDKETVALGLEFTPQPAVNGPVDAEFSFVAPHRLRIRIPAVPGGAYVWTLDPLDVDVTWRYTGVPFRYIGRIGGLMGTSTAFFSEESMSPGGMRAALVASGDLYIFLRGNSGLLGFTGFPDPPAGGSTHFDLHFTFPPIPPP